MMPVKTLLTAALSSALALALATTAFAQAEPEVVKFEGPLNVITQRADGVVVCEQAPVGLQAVPLDEPIPVPPHFHAVQANNQFAFDLYRRLAGSPFNVDNVFFSPLSISAALSLTYEGVAGDTQAQFEQVMHIPAGLSRDGFHSSQSSLLAMIDAENAPYQLTIANSLWGEQSMSFRNEFLDTLETHYDAGFRTADFKTNPQGERERINQWVEEQTNQRIVDLLPEPAITDLTRLVLANAIYFDADWQHPFNEGLTAQQTFHPMPNPLACSLQLGGTPTQTMTLPRAPLAYADLEGLDILEMPYQGGELSMVVLLPDEQFGLPQLESQLSNQALIGWLGQLERGPVRVQMPKWEMRQSVSLNDHLISLGMVDAFDYAQADFSRLSDSNTEGLAISSVQHQAFIRVDEQGTEAAAATAVVVSGRSAAIDRPFNFIADHPFIYLIRHNETGAILFMGRVTSPEAPAEDEAE